MLHENPHNKVKETSMSKAALKSNPLPYASLYSTFPLGPPMLPKLVLKQAFPSILQKLHSNLLSFHTFLIYSLVGQRSCNLIKVIHKSLVVNPSKLLTSATNYRIC